MMRFHSLLALFALALVLPLSAKEIPVSSLDLSPRDLAFAASAIKTYKENLLPVVQFGNLYRIENPHTGPRAVLDYVSTDRTRAALFVLQTKDAPATPAKPAGLDLSRRYRMRELNLPEGGCVSVASGRQSPRWRYAHAGGDTSTVFAVLRKHRGRTECSMRDMELTMNKPNPMILAALLLAPMVVLAGEPAPMNLPGPAKMQGSTLYNPAEPYVVKLPVYPVTYSEEQKKAQRDAGLALVREVNEAMRGKRQDFTAKPGIYRLPKGANFKTSNIDRFALHLPNCELILEPVPDRHLFSFGKANSFTLTGPVKVDFDPLPESQGRIVASDFATKRVTVEILPGYHALAPKISDKKNRDKTREEERFYTYSSSGFWLPNPSWSGFSWNDASLSADGCTVTFTAGKAVEPKLWKELYKPDNLVSLGGAGCGVLYCIWPDNLGELTVQDLDFYGGGFGWGNAASDSSSSPILKPVN